MVMKSCKRKRKSKAFQCDGCHRAISTEYNLSLHRKACKSARKKALEALLLDANKDAQRLLEAAKEERFDDSRAHGSSTLHKGSSLPFTCEFCGKCFRLFSHFNEHRRSHTWQRPFSCKDCGIRFAAEEPLRDHVEIHKDDTVPRSCVVCGEPIVGAKGLVWHLKTSHKKIMQNLELEGWEDDDDLFVPTT